jgi:hypothetical protein
MKWQPIETAPKDGTRVILCAVDGNYPRVAEGYYQRDGWHWSTDENWRDSEMAPTHWMPLPVPPTPG